MPESNDPCAAQPASNVPGSSPTNPGGIPERLQAGRILRAPPSRCHSELREESLHFRRDVTYYVSKVRDEKFSAESQAEAEGKLRRAKLTSVQLPPYYVGLRQWLALRKQYQERMGPRFDQLKFHNRVLDEGAIPLPMLEKIVDSW
jgi:hypothetical protein